MKKRSKRDIEKKIVKKYHDQIVFDLKRGFLQFMTLLIINRGSKYAYEIKTDILKMTMGGFDVDRNNLYKKLRSLERDGILRSHMEPSERGANRKYYTITSMGKKLLDKNSDLLFPLMKSLRKNITKRLD
jgi:DNA-binding PadR family transcriptional regulator